MLITAMHAFDELVLVIALPRISTELHSQAWYGLIIASYILASIAGMTWAGKRIDARGPLPVFLLAMTSFALGLVLAVLAQNTLTFVIARMLQGLGGGLGWTMAFALINLLCEPKQKSRAIAAMDIAWVVPSLLAPSIGGWLVDHMHWHWIFVVQFIPLSLALLLITPRIRHMGKSGGTTPWHVVSDAIRIAAGVGFFLYILSTPPGLLWWLLLPTFLVSMAPFNRHMPEQWWRARSSLSIAMVVAMPAFLVFYGMEAFLPLYLIEVRDLSSITAGLILSTASVSWMLGSIAQSRLQYRFNEHQAMLAGFMLLTGSLLLQGLIINQQELSVYWSYPVWALAGLGMGITFNAARTSALHNTPQNQEGAVATSISLAANMGIGIAAGVGGAIKNHFHFLGGSLSDAMLAIDLFSVVTGLAVIVLLALRMRSFARAQAAGSELRIEN